MSIFKISEIMDIGIEKEEKRRDFYGKVKGMFPEEDLKELFTKLESWEGEHIQKFTNIKNALSEEEKVMETYKGEMEDYIEAFLDNKLYLILNNEDDFKSKVKTSEDALNIAMDFEKDAIIFFSELLNFVEEKDKDTIMTLIKEEKQHLIFLHNMKKKIKK